MGLYGDVKGAAAHDRVGERKRRVAVDGQDVEHTGIVGVVHKDQSGTGHSGDGPPNRLGVGRAVHGDVRHRPAPHGGGVRRYGACLRRAEGLLQNGHGVGRAARNVRLKGERRGAAPDGERVARVVLQGKPRAREAADGSSNGETCRSTRH